jgi:L,D-transpeptidase YcbB
LQAQADAVRNRLRLAEEDGLQAADYPVIAPGDQPAPAALAQADIALSAAVFAYARDARGGRIEPSRLSRLMTPDLDLPSPADVLAHVGRAADAGEALAAYNPPHEGYRALRQALAVLPLTTGSVARPAPVAAPSKPGSSRERRAITSADIIANMERWRWLPRDLGAKHIRVNLPEYLLRVVQDGQVIHKAKVIVGKLETPTPVFSHAMEYVIVNPSWYIPPSILKKEILPGLAADPGYAAKRGYQVTWRNGAVSVRQPPGERNALGFIKFMFPNLHAVYLHDTPSRALFGQEKRAFSHGCVRVDQPFRLAQFVLGDQGFDEDRLRRMIGKGERLIRLKQPIPVHLTYFTLDVEADGRVVQRDDLYGHDKRVQVALGLAGGKPRLARLH